MMAPETETPAIPVLEVPVTEMLTVLDELKTTLLRSTAMTHHQLEQILSPILRDERHQQIHSGCEIIFRNISKEFGRILSIEPPYEHPMRALARHCEAVQRRWREGPVRIQNYLQPFLQRAGSVLIHGHSTVICDALLHAFTAHRLRLIFTEGAPLMTGKRSVDYITERWRTQTGNEEICDALCVIPDSAAATIIPSVSFLLVAANAVTISGGAVGMIGCHQLAILAHALGKDFYVIAEVFRFSRIFPLSSHDVRPIRNDAMTEGDSQRVQCPGGENQPFPLLDYIPPTHIAMFFTNIGLFPPATAADELYTIFMGDCAGGNLSG